MPEITPEFGNWILQTPYATWVVLLWVAVVILYGWLKKVDPASFVKGLIHRRKNKLENMLKLDYLQQEDRSHIERELRQIYRNQLTGFFQQSLQEVALNLSARFNVPTRYLSQWGIWLSDCEAQIYFNQKWYYAAFYSSILFQLVFTFILILMVYYFNSHHNQDFLAPFIAINLIGWWGPLLLLTSLPTLKATKEMKKRLKSINEDIANNTPT